MKKTVIYFISLLFAFSLFHISAYAAKNNSENKTIQSETNKTKSNAPYLVKIKPLKLKIFKKTSLKIASLKKAAIAYYKETGAWPLDALKLKAFGLKEWDSNSSWGTPINFYVENGEFVISNKAPDNLHEAFEGFGRIETDKKSGKVNIHISPPDSFKIRDGARLFERDIVISKDSPTLQLEDTNLSEANLSNANLSDANNSLSVFIMNKNGELVILDNERLPNIAVKQKGDVEVKGNLSAVSNTIRLKNIENEGTSLIEMQDSNNTYKAILRVGDKYKNYKKQIIPEGFQLGTISKHPVTMLVNNSPRIVIDEENITISNNNTFNISSGNVIAGNITADNININKTINGEDINRLLEGLIAINNYAQLGDIINKNQNIMTESNIEEYALTVAGTKALVGDIIPAVSSKYVIGADGRTFKEGHFDELYISGSSLYMDGIKVLSSKGVVLNGDISGSGVKTVIDEENPSDVKLASETAITNYVQEKVANISGIPGRLKLGGDFITTGDIKLNVMGGGSTEITLPVTGTLATREWVLEQNLSAGLELSGLKDVADALPNTAGNILIWDNGGILQSKALRRDVTIDNQYGDTTVHSIGGKPITLGGPFTTTNPIKFDALKDVTIKIEDSGTLATQDYVAGLIEGSNISATLQNLIDTDITASSTSGDIIIWDAVSQKWVNRKVSQDVSLEKTGAATVKSIGGKPISLGAEFKTTGAGKIELNAPTQDFRLTIEDNGTIATKEYVASQIQTENAMPTDITSPSSGQLIIWDGDDEKWVNRTPYQDIYLEKDGKVTVKKIGGKLINIESEFKTTGAGPIEFNASSPVSVAINRSGILATIADIEDYVKAAGGTAKLKDLVDTTISSAGGGDLLIWDGSANWVNRALSGDISLNNIGEATVNKIGGKPITISSKFETSGEGNIKLQTQNASPVSVIINDSGTLATQEYVMEKISNATGSVSLKDLADTTIADTIGSGNILIWDGADWVNRSMSGDIGLAAGGAATVSTIGGKPISLGAEFKTTGGNIELKNSYTSPVSVEIIDGGILATRTYVDNQILAANKAAKLENLIDTNISSPLGGNILIWDTGRQQWVNRKMIGDAELSADGTVKINSINNKNITLGGAFETSDDITLNASTSVVINIPKSGALATMDDLNQYITAANNSATLENLVDTNISETVASGDMLLWNNIRKQWYNKQLIGDASIDKDGNITVKTLKSGAIEFNATNGPVSIDIPKSGKLATVDDINVHIAAANKAATLDNLIDTNISASPVSGDILLWNADNEQWYNKPLIGDALIDKDGNITVNSLKSGMVEFDASSHVSIQITKSGRLARMEDLEEYIIAANATASLSNLVDTDITSATKGNILIWDDTANKWINTALSKDVTIDDSNGATTVHSIDGKPISLGAGFNTNGPGTIEFNASSPVSIEIKDSGTLATQDYIAGQIEAANKAAELRNLVDTEISAAPSNGDILVWDGGKWYNRQVTGDIIFSKSGKVTIDKINDKSIKLGGGFETTGEGTIVLGGPPSGKSVNVLIEESGTLATKEYVDSRIVAANNSATLKNLVDTDVSDTIASGDILVWDGAKWFNRKLGGDIELTPDGNAQVNSIGGMAVALKGAFETTGAGKITVNNPSEDIAININKSGSVAMIDDLNTYIANAVDVALLNKLADTNISDAVPLDAGNILVWDGTKWFNRKVAGDIAMSDNGEVTVSKIAGKSISLGADFKTNGAGTIEFNASSPVSIEITESGKLATQDYVNARINDSGRLKSLIDTDIDDTVPLDAGDILVWDGIKWFNRKVYGDIDLAAYGKALVKSIDGVFINLSNNFQTKGPGAINITAPADIEVRLEESGIVATQNYVSEKINEVNGSGTLRNLTDTDLSSEDILYDGSVLVWDRGSNKWRDKEIGGDANFTNGGYLTVNKISGETIVLGGALKTSDEFITNGGNITFNADGETILTLPKTGILANKDYVDTVVGKSSLRGLNDVIVNNTDGGAILIWDPAGVNKEGNATGVWRNLPVTGDGTIDSTGKLTITHIGGQPITLGGELKTEGKFITTGGDITLRAAGGSASLILPSTGTLATLDNVTDMIKASNLTDLNDVDINSETLAGGQILVWDDDAAQWTNKGVSGDVDLNVSGNTTVKSIGGYPVQLGGDFTTYGNIILNTSEAEANLTLPATGVLATLEGNETFLNKIIKDSNGSFDKLSLDFESNKYGANPFDEQEKVRWVMALKDENGTAEWRRAIDIGAIWTVGADNLHSELAYYDDNETDNKSLGIGFNFNLINEDETPYPITDNQSFDISETNNENTILDYELYVGSKDPFGGSIYAYGHVMAQDYYEFSDRRLKENIVEISSQTSVTDKIRNIKGVYYDWNSLYYDKNKINKKQGRQIGFIAQKVEKEFPELVQTETDGFKSVTYSKFVPVLLEGLKELDTQLNRRQNSLFIDPEGNINLKGIVKIDDTTLIDKQGNIASNNIKVKGNIQASNTFSIVRSDTLASLITISTEKKADEKVEGYISAKDIYIADKNKWASEFDSKIKIVSDMPNDTSCSADNAGEMLFISKDSTLCICSEKGVWKRFNTSEKEKLTASANINPASD